MTKILVLYYSMYGHIEIMAKAIAEGVRSANADVVIKRVPDTMSPEVAKQYGAKLEQEAPFAKPDELPQCHRGWRLKQITVPWMDEQRNLSKNQLLFSTSQQVHQRRSVLRDKR